MIDDYLTASPWIALAIWVALYISDYYLTLWGARLYKETGSAFIDMDGSYELTPLFQKDIDALRRVSPEFIWQLFLSSGMLLFIWWFAVRYAEAPIVFFVCFGSVVLVELVVHIRHRRNISFFLFLRTADAVQGHLRYQRWITERQSTVELSSFGILFTICYVISEHPLFIGGSVGCFSLAIKHARQARRSRS